MTSRKKSRKRNKKIILPLLLFVFLLVGAVFAIDYFAQEAGINNELTQSVHSAREEVEDLARETKAKVEEAFKLENQTDTEKETPAPEITEDIPFQFPENLEIPLCPAARSGSAEDHQIRHFGNYTICYRETYEQAEWAAYCLEKDELVKNASRGNDFRPDPEITTGSASLADYKKSGYDRGHLAPAADFAFSEEAMSESFYLSNMSPQAPGLNREIWQYLEGQVRKWAEEYGKVYVVTGPVLEKPSDQYDSIGENQVSVPEYYYKALIAPDGDNAKGIGFILPNKKCDDTFWDYAVSIDEIERRTSLDFFHLLENNIEDKIEASVSIKNWK